MSDAPETTDAADAGGPSGAAPGRLRDFVSGRLGTRRVEVRAAGPEGEIALLRVPAETLDRLLAPGVRETIVERARAEGFRYAALDLSLLTPPARPDDTGHAGLA